MRTFLPLTFFAALWAPAAVGQLQFQSLNPMPTGLAPDGLVVADLDGDGDPDAAVANSDQNAISLFFTQQGGLTPGAMVAIPGQATDVTAADFDGDGDLDLATANANVDTVSILTNQGGGAFVVTVTVATSKKPRHLAAADFDGDGDVDLAVAERGADSVRLLRNDGTVFVTAGQFPVAADPRMVAAADFDGDGDVDLALAGHDGNAVTVLRNDGGFSFVASASLFLLRPNGVIQADLDGDGDADLLVSQGNVTPPMHGLVVFLNDGAGSFANSGLHPTGQDPHGLSAFDADSDGDLDVALAVTAANELAVFENLGAGQLASAVSFATGALPQDVGAGDFDGDGQVDLLVSEEATSTATPFANQSIQHFERFGAGCPGLLRVAPSLDGAGQAQGGGQVVITVSAGPPAAPAVLLVGGQEIAQPAAGCVLYVGGTPIPIGLALDAQGAAALSAMLPPSVPTATIVMQAAVADAGSPNGVFSLSNGLRMNLH